MIIPLGPLTIKIDVLIVQIINIWILLFLFKKLFGDIIVAEIQNRKQLISKLSNADGEYNTIIQQAHQEKDKLIDEWKTHKAHLMQEAIVVAKKTEEALVSKAHEQAQSIVSQAESKIQVLEKNVMNQFEDSVKQTVKTVVKKLIKSDQEIKSAYLDTLVREVASSK